MNLFRQHTHWLVIMTISLLWSCKQETQWEGQKPIKKVSTQTVPIQLQYKGTFDLGKGVFISNEFEGARLNGVARINDTLITILITPENAPINTSPWYAFKIWAETEREISLKLTYPESAGHRYFPQLSLDGVLWTLLDSAKYKLTMKAINDEELVPKEMMMNLSVGPDTLWISAQELITSSHVDAWITELTSHSFVTKTTIGESHEGRPINLIKVGESDDQKMIIVLSRQHPPEVPGFLAMKAFVETICSEGEIAENFRKNYNTYVVPVANPDGVYHGHWRHNRGGIDLNRDWSDFNQPETSAIKDFMKRKTAITGGKFFFGIDFHSTFEDIYYTISPELKGNMPGLVPDMILATAQEFEDYEPNIKSSSEVGVKVTSSTYFFYEYGAESLTYEVGDNTPREFVRKKGEVSAMKLMELMQK